MRKDFIQGQGKAREFVVGQGSFRALDKREYLVIIRDNFC